MRATPPPLASILRLALTFALSVTAHATATQTTLTISPSASVQHGTTVILTAHVTASGAPVHPGTVTFCNASATHCEDPAILGTAQLTTSGTAKLYLRLAPGAHVIKAIFSATPNSAIPRASSTSASVSITVHGTANSLTAPPTAIKAGNYYQFSTIIDAFGAVPLTGTVSFHDTVNGGTPLLLGSAPVGPSLAQPIYTLPIPVTSPVTTDTVVVGDFNNDGIPDIAGINYVTNFTQPTLVLLLGHGDGTFTSTIIDLPNSGFPFIGTAGDFNGDGNLDLAISGDYDAILLGHGDGTFSDPIFYYGGGGTLIATDMNGDGILDLVGINGNTGETFYLGNGDGTFTPSSFAGLIGFGTTVLGDFNKDGIPDFVTIPGVSSYAQTLLLNADGTYTSKNAFLLPSSPQDIQYMATGDFNNDGIPDIVTSRFDNSVAILLGNGDGTFTPSIPTPFSTPWQNLSVADFNNDGKLDIALLNYGVALTILPGNGNGTFGVPFNVAPAKPIGIPVVIADFNGDGLNDIFYETPNQTSNNLFLLQGERAWPASIANIPLQANLVHNVTASYQGSAAYSASQSSPIVVPTFPNITTKLHFSTTGLIYSYVTHTFNCTLTVTNTSGSPIAGPIQIGFQNLPASVSLANPTSPQVPGFIAIPAGLAAGQSASFALRFNNSLIVPITLIPVAYTGAF